MALKIFAKKGSLSLLVDLLALMKESCHFCVFLQGFATLLSGSNRLLTLPPGLQLLEAYQRLSNGFANYSLFFFVFKIIYCSLYSST